MDPEQISASELKANCSRMIARVERGRETLTITRHGRPVARLVPIDEEGQSLFGCLRGSVTIHGDIVDPLDVSWEAAE